MKVHERSRCMDRRFASGFNKRSTLHFSIWIYLGTVRLPLLLQEDPAFWPSDEGRSEATSCDITTLGPNTPFRSKPLQVWILRMWLPSVFANILGPSGKTSLKGIYVLEVCRGSQRLKQPKAGQQASAPYLLVVAPAQKRGEVGRPGQPPS